MVLEDRHIDYLKLVDRRLIKLWQNPTRSVLKYVNSSWTNGPVDVDQTVAAQMHALGATHIVYSTGIQYVALTKRGEDILNDEAESWA